MTKGIEAEMSGIDSSPHISAGHKCTGLLYQASHHSLWRKAIISCFLLIGLLLATTACQFTQSAFSSTVGNAGAAFAAASTTLTYLHEGKITTLYARSTFVNYQSELSGLDQQLPSQPGRPDTHTVQQLLALYRTAMQAVNQPCLNSSCDWHTQVAALDRASKEFLKAGGQ